MYRFGKSKGEGYILIYTLIICGISLFIAMGCYKLEFLIKQNASRMEKNLVKVDKTQKIKENLFTAMDGYIYENVGDINEEEISKFLHSSNEVMLKFEESTIKYNKDKDCFLVQYNINHAFIKEELYEYKVRDTSIIYGCIDYSYTKGGLI